MYVPSLVLLRFRVAEILRGKNVGKKMPTPAAGGWPGDPAAAELNKPVGETGVNRNTFCFGNSGTETI